MDGCLDAVSVLALWLVVLLLFLSSLQGFVSCCCFRPPSMDGCLAAVSVLAPELCGGEAAVSVVAPRLGGGESASINTHTVWPPTNYSSKYRTDAAPHWEMSWLTSGSLTCQLIQVSNGVKATTELYVIVPITRAGSLSWPTN